MQLGTTTEGNIRIILAGEETYHQRGDLTPVFNGNTISVYKEGSFRNPILKGEFNAITNISTGLPFASLAELKTFVDENFFFELSGTGGGGSWGTITGALSDQTDLHNALAAKQNTITTGTTAQYFRGDLSLANFPTSLSAFSNEPGYLTAANFGTGLTIAGGTVTNDLSTGKAGGQSIYGGTANGNHLNIYASSHATPGQIRLMSNTRYNGYLIPEDSPTYTYRWGISLENLQAYHNGQPVQTVIAGYYNTTLFNGNGAMGLSDPTHNNFNLRLNGNLVAFGLTGGTYTDLRISPNLNFAANTLSGTYTGISIEPVLTNVNNATINAFRNTVGNNLLNTVSGGTVIGGSTFAGYKLDVQGTARFTGTTEYSAAQTITLNSLGTNSNAGVMLQNTTPAASGAQQVSPSIRWTGQGWGGSSQPVEFRAFVLPTQRAGAPTGTLVFQSQVNSGVWQNVFNVNSNLNNNGFPGISAPMASFSTGGEYSNINARAPFHAGQNENTGVRIGTIRPGAQMNGIQSVVGIGTIAAPLILNPYGGKVGIGTGSTNDPNGWLEIVAGTAATPQMFFQVSANCTNNTGTSAALWFDGTNLKLRIGTTDYTIQKV